MNIQTRLEVQLAVQQWVDNFMHQYQIPANVMDDALAKVQGKLKDQVILELLTETAQEQQKEEVNGSDPSDSQDPVQ